MRKNAAEFRQLFLGALSDAHRAAGGSNGIAPNATIELHLNGVHDRTIEEAAEELFLGEERFFCCIDVAVHPKRGESSAFFVRVSGHEPASWERTWHPETTGPFHIMTPA